jgi:ribonuclease HI
MGPVRGTTPFRASSSTDATTDKPIVQLNVLQLNLGKHHNGINHLLANAVFDVALISEPPTYCGQVSNAGSFSVFQKRGAAERVKAAILVHPKHNAIMLDASDANAVFVRITFGNRTLVFASVYYEPRGNLRTQLESLVKVRNSFRGTDFLLAGDLNAKSASWMSNHTDKRGAWVDEALSEMGLTVLNDGATPTFERTCNGKTLSSIVDVTAASASLADAVADWKVSNDMATLSDHNAITFAIGAGRLQREFSDDTRRFDMKNWNTDKFDTAYSKLVDEKKLTLEKFHNAPDATSLIMLINLWITCVSDSLQQSAPRVKRSRGRNPWWTPKLDVLRRNVAELRRQFKERQEDEHAERLIKNLSDAEKEYSKAMDAAKTSSWRNLMASMDPSTAWTKLMRILRRGRAQPPSIVLVNGTPTTSTEETMDALMKHFFREDNALDDTTEQAKLRRQFKKDAATPDDALFTLFEILDAANSMSPKKAPGKDLLTADVVSRAIVQTPELALEAFNACLRLSCFPPAWKHAIIRCIPKKDRDDYRQLKAYRPIGLLSVLGKVLEKAMVRRLEYHLASNGRSHPNQFGFTAQKSTLDAISTITNFMKNILASNDYAAVISLDIEGAFDNAWWPYLMRELRDAKTPRNIYKLIHSYLEDRTSEMSSHGLTIGRKITMGAIQGSIGGPCFFKIIVANLLRRQLPSDAHLIFYADDGTLMVKAKSVKDLEQRTNAALEVIANWGLDARLKFSASKTQTMFVTKRQPKVKPKFVMSGVNLEFTKTMTVLGVILTPKLCWTPHVLKVCGRIRELATKLGRASHATWGASPDVLRILVSGALMPMALYAANIWGKGLTKDNRNKLNSAMLPAVRRVCKAYRTTSKKAAFAMARLTPLDIQVDAAVKQAQLILRPDHRELESGRGVVRRAAPEQLPHPAIRQQIAIFETEHGKDIPTMDAPHIDIYTDGSKHDDRVGAAFVVFNNTDEEEGYARYRLADVCTVYQAECLAAIHALKWTQTNWTSSCVRIFTDSLSMCQGLKQLNTTCPMLVEINRLASTLRDAGRQLEIHWIRGHQDLYGNERADVLAKEAADEPNVHYSRIPKSRVKKIVREEATKAWAERYAELDENQNLIKKFFKTPTSASKTLSRTPINFFLAQALTGHGGNRSYLKRFMLRPDDACTCDNRTPQTIKHLINRCPLFDEGRQQVASASKSQSPWSWSKLITHKSTSRVFVQFLEETAAAVYKQNSTGRTKKKKTQTQPDYFTDAQIDAVIALSATFPADDDYFTAADMEAIFELHRTLNPDVDYDSDATEIDDTDYADVDMPGAPAELDAATVDELPNEPIETNSTCVVGRRKRKHSDAPPQTGRQRAKRQCLDI